MVSQFALLAASTFAAGTSTKRVKLVGIISRDSFLDKCFTPVIFGSLLRSVIFWVVIPAVMQSSRVTRNQISPKQSARAQKLNLEKSGHFPRLPIANIHDLPAMPKCSATVVFVWLCLYHFNPKSVIL